MSALTLKLIACTAMLVDHIGYLWGVTLFRAIGRIAFPVFLFLIYNGYRHTRSKGRYALRLGLFALISQVPFSLFSANVWLESNGNVFFSLLLALLCIWAADALRRYPVGRYFSMVPALVLFLALTFGAIRADNGTRAMVLAMAFWYLEGNTDRQRLGIAICTVFAVFSNYFILLGQRLLDWLAGGQLALPIPSQWQRLQLCALLALPLIFAYNGSKGRMPAGKRSAKAVQLGFYLFYPAHLLILWAIKRFF